MQDAISVVDPQSDILLFSNSVYDSLFGDDSLGHMQAHEELINQLGDKAKDAPDISADIYIEKMDRWFALHERIITWTDRTAVRLQILSDITERRKNENLLAEQQARSEQNSRLVTMGEMASSLAHELNQPLTAISNYAFIVGSMMKKAGVPEEHEMFYSVSPKSMRCFTLSLALKRKLKEPPELFSEFAPLPSAANRKWNPFRS